MGFLDLILGWVLELHPAIGIIIIALLVSLLVTLILKFFTNQSLMKDLKEEQKELQKQMKTLRNNPSKLAKVNSQFMETNMKYMTHSMRASIFTILPVFIIFAWLNTHIGFMPLVPGEPFEISIYFDKAIDDTISIEFPEQIELIEEKVYSDKATWRIHPKEEGEYLLNITYKDLIYQKKVLITTEKRYEKPDLSLKQKKLLFSSYDENRAERILVNNEKVLPFSDVLIVKNLPWISGWGWLGVYLLFSMIFSMTLRNLLKVY